MCSSIPQNCEQTRANSLKCFPQIDAKETPFWGSENNHENGGYFRPSFPCFISQRNSSLLWVSFSDPQNGVLSRQFVETFVLCWQFCGHGGSQQASKVDWCKFGNYGWKILANHVATNSMAYNMTEGCNCLDPHPAGTSRVYCVKGFEPEKLGCCIASAPKRLPKKSTTSGFQWLQESCGSKTNI